MNIKFSTKKMQNIVNINKPPIERHAGECMHLLKTRNSSCLTFLISLLLIFNLHSSFSQNWFADSTKSLKVLARPLPDSIILRWAPVNYATWEKGNRYGYKVIRYTLIRDEKLVTTTEEKLLTATSLKPLEMMQWKPLVEKNKYAAITAQAMFGKTFLVDAKGINPSQVKNISMEQQQRFGFAVYAADLSPEVARASGLMLVDKDVKKNEKYLYRVIIDIPPTEKIKRDTGSIFTGVSYFFELPQPFDLKAEFGDRTVIINWNVFAHNTIYIAYNLERSTNKGKTFERVNHEPIVQIVTDAMQNPELMYSADSLKENGKEYQYRVQGITSFGETGSWSKAISGKGIESITFAPNIIKQEIIKGKVKITWDFPKDAERKITGFKILRANNHKAGFINLTPKNIKPQVREYIDKSPIITAYYKVEAFADSTIKKESYPELVQLTDSIPPHVPNGFVGTVDSSNIVHLSWKRNTDEDIYGYRVFRSVSGKDEYSQLTHAPITDTFFIDTLNKKDLNNDVFYKIIANDQRQNQSLFTKPLKLTKPDMIAPSAPVFKDVKISEGRIDLVWINSSSPDVKKYILYRCNKGDTAWTKIYEIAAKKKEFETTYSDTKAGNDTVRKYRVTAVDESGNHSTYAESLEAKGFKSYLKQGIKKIDKTVDKEKGRISLSWKKPEAHVKNYIIYRKTKTKEYSMYETLEGSVTTFEDYGIKIGDVNAYRIKIIFTDGSVSGFSEEVDAEF